jgi:hypothetical protein
MGLPMLEVEVAVAYGKGRAAWLSWILGCRVGVVVG